MESKCYKNTVVKFKKEIISKEWKQSVRSKSNFYKVKKYAH